MGRKNLKDWNKLYRLSLMDDRSHKKIRSWHFSVLGVAVASVTMVVVILGTIYLLLALTPLKTIIPGYPDANSKSMALLNAIKIDSLDNAINRWHLYAENLDRVLAGEQTLELDSIIKSDKTKYLRGLSEAELARRDSLFRAGILKEEQFGVSAKTERKLPIEGMHFFTPLKGTILQSFDIVLHPGVDIAAPTGSVVCSTLDGTVIFAGWTDATGYTIIIQHPSEIISVYSRNDKLLKKTGDKVAAGSSIALLGNTGSMNSSDHLHFELWHEGQAVDPARFCNL